MSNPTNIDSPAEVEVKLVAEIAQITRELEALPLINQNKKLRLELNDRKLKLQAERVSLLREGQIATLKMRLEEIQRELAALGDTPQDRLRRVELKKMVPAVRVELDDLVRQR